MGSLSAALFRSRLGSTLAAAHLPHRVTDLASGSIAAADAVGRQVGGGRGAELVSAAHSAFVTAMADGMRIAAVVALAAAIGAVFALPRRRAGVPGAAAAGALAAGREGAPAAAVASAGAPAVASATAPAVTAAARGHAA